MAKSFKKAAEEADRRGVGTYRRHVFICIGPDCCSSSEGERAWGRLKKRLGELDKDRTIYRTKVGCLRVCEQGPVAVVYPEGTWYAGLDGSLIGGIGKCGEGLGAEVIVGGCWGGHRLSITKADAVSASA
ncbi:MAG: (2Fe-2S) ferredoxin domain-containing protein [Tepidiformaceae bacterium]